MNINAFSIDQLIIHEITKAEDQRPAELLLSKVVSALDDDIREYFEDRITESLRTAAFPVVVDPNVASPTPDLLFRQLTGKRPSFSRMSQELAQHLFKAQESVSSSPGLLVVVVGTVDTGGCVGILKLQKQEGVRLERTGAAGRETYSVEHLRQLMLTNETRVFKVALFDAAGLRTVDDLKGLVSDKQRGFRPEKQVADFFLRTFLGCQVRDNPAQSTSRFFHETEKFLNSEIADAQARTRGHRALLTELTSRGTTVDPRDFARRYLDDEDQPRYLAHLGEADVPLVTFDKNTELIKTKLDEWEYALESGLKVRGPEQAWKDHVEQKQTKGNELELLIRDRLHSIRGR